MIEEEAIKRKFEMLDGELNERTRRLAAAAEAMALGWGGISAVARATGISQRAIGQGIKELKSKETLSQGRIRRVGGGRKKTVSKDASLAEDLEQLMEPVNRGDLESQLRWTCKNVRQLAAELQDLGHQVSYPLVSELLHDLGYSLRAYRQVRKGDDYSFRDTQFSYLNEEAKSFVLADNPVVSIDIRKKEVLVDDTNSGSSWRSLALAGEISINDFLDAGSVYVTPYSTFDPAHNASWKKIGIDLDTIAFVFESLRHWWKKVGESRYPKARKLLISAHCMDGIESYSPLWKWKLQQLSNEIRLAITFCHLPTGTYKWCKNEHSLFAWMNQNERGKLLTNYAIILRNITATTPDTEQIVQYQLDTKTYRTGYRNSVEKLSSKRMEIEIYPSKWNYTIFRQKGIGM